MVLQEWLESEPQDPVDQTGCSGYRLGYARTKDFGGSAGGTMYCEVFPNVKFCACSVPDQSMPFLASGIAGEFNQAGFNQNLLGRRIELGDERIHRRLFRISGNNHQLAGARVRNDAAAFVGQTCLLMDLHHIGGAGVFELDDARGKRWRRRRIPGRDAVNL